MDMAGTWSDTPPICYEHGGSVITIGVKIDGQVFTISYFGNYLFIYLPFLRFRHYDSS